MKITCCEAKRFIHLHTSEMSYALGWAEDGRLLNLYWGKVMGSDDAIASIAEDKLLPVE